MYVVYALIPMLLLVAGAGPSFSQRLTADEIRKHMESRGVPEEDIIFFLESTGRIETERTRKEARRAANLREESAEANAQADIHLCAHRITVLVVLNMGLQWGRTPQDLLALSAADAPKIRNQFRRLIAKNSRTFAQWLHAMYVMEDKDKKRDILQKCANLKVPKL